VITDETPDIRICVDKWLLTSELSAADRKRSWLAFKFNRQQVAILKALAQAADHPTSKVQGHPLPG
jgi:hypothetical protein